MGAHLTHSILVVNDDLPQCELYKYVLESAHYSVETAFDGQEGVGKALELHPSLIISDVIMPVMDGIELVKAVRAEPTLAATPVLLASALATDDWQVLEGLQAGADDYLRAPFEPALLEAKAAHLVERYRAEKALRKSEERLQVVIENLAEGVIVCELNGQIIHWNRASLEMHGVQSLDEWLLKLQDFQSIFELSHLDGTPLGFEEWPLNQIIRGEQLRNFEIRIRRIGTEWKRIFSYGGSLVREPNGRQLAILTVTDITDRVQLEERYRQAQKMEAVGRLAGGVAHDFNNLMTAVLGFASLAERRLGPANPVEIELAEIKRAGERASMLTSQLLAFSRKQILQPRLINISHAVAEAVKLLRQIIGEDILLKTQLENELTVYIDPAQLDQVLVNLAVNARDAMPSGGELTIKTKAVTLTDEYASLKPEVRPGDYVRLSISDTGIGLTEEVKARLFEPFFTTKEPGKGTGLGLATVYGIVKQSNGFIYVYSEPGEGTTFEIYFPSVASKIDSVTEGTKSTELRSGSETILLVEDEAMVRKLAMTVLVSAGYQVLAADSPDEAMKLFENANGKIDLLLTDMVMPKLNGRELADRLQKISPHLKVIYMSGYTDHSIIHQGLNDESLEFLQKPFSLDELTALVRKVLDEKVV